METQEKYNRQRIVFDGKLSRGECLQKAQQIINGERQNSYGNPEDSFRTIAEYWKSYIFAEFDIKIPMQKKDVMIMMALLKIARMSGQKYNPDNFVDAAGYLALADDEVKKND